MVAMEPEVASRERPEQQTHGSGAWLHVVSHIDPRFGGMSAAVPKLAAELLQRQALETRIACFCLPDERPDLSYEPQVSISVWPPDRKRWIGDSTLRRGFQEAVRVSSGVHIHGLWEASTLAAAWAARNTRTPYVISPHGMLESWALANKRRKKQMYAALFERRNLNGAACVHALTRAEAWDCRTFGYKGPIAIIPNGVDVPVKLDPALFRSRFKQLAGARLVLFLGRVHYKKGVDLLLRAWATLADLHPDVVLVVAGPDSEGTLAKLAHLLVELKLSSRVLFTGMLKGPEKWSAFAAADFFVLPSYSEGLSVATLEALACGVPVIISRQCNLSQVEEAGAGWQVTTEVDDLALALKAALEATPETYADMSTRARELAQRGFSWGNVTNSMAQLYRWISGGPAPLDVEFLEGDV